MDSRPWQGESKHLETDAQQCTNEWLARSQIQHGHELEVPQDLLPSAGNATGQHASHQKAYWEEKREAGSQALSSKYLLERDGSYLNPPSQTSTQQQV